MPHIRGPVPRRNLHPPTLLLLPLTQSYRLLRPTDAAITKFLKDMGMTVDDLKKRPLLAKQLVAQHTLLGDNGACTRCCCWCLPPLFPPLHSTTLRKRGAHPQPPTHARAQQQDCTGLQAKQPLSCCDQAHSPDGLLAAAAVAA